MRVTASILNVRSGPGLGFRVLGKLHRDQDVTVLETSGDWSWVEPGEGWVHRAFLEPVVPIAPRGLSSIVKRFGQPGAPAASGGRVRLPAPLKLGWADSEVNVVACHVDMVEVFTNVFKEIHARGLWPHLKTFDGIYNDRSVKRAGKKSTHAWGIAVDLNAATNRKNPGDMHPEIIEIFERHGFLHGREFNDPMHFQYASGY